MDMIKGITFAPFAPKGTLGTSQAKASLLALAQRTGASHIILVPTGIQQTPYAEAIDFSGNGSPGDDELLGTIRYAQSLGLQVILKPTVNCANGVWRAYINFFDNDVPGEPQWKNWFASYRRFQLHYARIAQRTGCAMFIAGCEMVMAQRRDAEWRALIGDIKSVYGGPVSYNTDKYQEENVGWWDCVDVISSSGYYPRGSWRAQLERIGRVAEQYQKPFFFAEAGCMSARGSAMLPNNWELQGAADATEQAEWYEDMFAATRQYPWVGGYGLWDWPAVLYPEEAALSDSGYTFFAKPAEAVIKKHFEAL